MGNGIPLRPLRPMKGYGTPEGHGSQEGHKKTYRAMNHQRGPRNIIESHGVGGPWNCYIMYLVITKSKDIQFWLQEYG